MPATTIGPAVERDVAQPLVLSLPGMLVFACTVARDDAPFDHHDVIEYGTDVAVMICFLLVAGRVVCRRLVARSC